MTGCKRQAPRYVIKELHPGFFTELHVYQNAWISRVPGANQFAGYIELSGEHMLWRPTGRACMYQSTKPSRLPLPGGRTPGHAGCLPVRTSWEPVITLRSLPLRETERGMSR
jgi:hypothetical protein